MDISVIFLIIGVIIIIGFLGGLFFQRTSTPDVLILLLIGVLLGPVFKITGDTDLSFYAEYFGSFALMIILFEGGMEIDIHRLIKGVGTATLLVVTSFLLSASFIGAYLHLVLGWDLARSLLLGIILGCTSSAIVIPVIHRLSVGHSTRIILAVESALSDVIAVVLAVTVIDYLLFHDIGIQTPFRTIASSFSIAIVSGAAAGCFWLKALDILKKKNYSYMVTLAVLLLLYAVVDFLGGSGPIAVLVFGIILGNSKEFLRFLKLRKDGWAEETIKFFHGEVSFFVRTFFFVYMGMMISFTSLDPEFLSVVGALMGIILFSRFISVRMMAVLSEDIKQHLSLVFFMLPRGLASAVLATLPLSANIKGCEMFINYTFGVIVLSSLFMTIGVVYYGKKNQATTVADQHQDGTISGP